ncbi:hypothetical protein BKA61DRAFT_617863 [Leptodontidium sp. MPI-SDFR-AT-0119]|nr:hypothetical protein BKA61DRAFT_617863 [Leptodontidium sp. MPI-SDFR-AT-0119]
MRLHLVTMRHLQPSGPAPPIQTPPIVKPKACLSCRTRKIKCDRNSPCTHCTSWSLECVFPSPIRRCPRPRKKQIVPPLEEFSGIEARQSLGERIQKAEKTLHKLTDSIEGNHVILAESNEFNESYEVIQDYSGCARRLEAIETTVGGLITRRNGIKLVGVKPVFASHRSTNTTSSSSGLFPFNSFTVEVGPLHPSPTQAQTCWRIFLENGDKLVKVLHRLSTEAILRKAMHDTTSLNKGQEALLFAIYFSSISSMTAADAENCFKMPKHAALMAYRSVTEQMLMRADFLTTSDLTTFQAFVLFLSFSQFTDKAKLVWALTGLARRLGCSATATLSPFTKEIHRRLWWQLWYLDRRAAEDGGKDASSADAIIESELPLNINDSDLDPCMMTVPAQRHGWTEMSFCIIRFEIAKTSCKVEGDLPHDQKEKIINECEYKIQSRHLRDCDNSDPIHWLAQHVAHVLITEMRIKLHNQACHSPRDPAQTLVTRNQLFLAAIDIVDISRRLEIEPHAEKWKWLLSAYLQFLPLTFLLTELGQRQNGGMTDHAREVAEKAFMRWTEESKNSKNGDIIRQLMDKAEARRRQVVEWQSLERLLLPPDPSGPVAGLTMVGAESSSAEHDPQLADVASFFVGEQQDYDLISVQSLATEDMVTLGSMDYTPGFVPGSYNGSNWGGNRSYLDAFDSNSEGIELSNVYDF